jgi:hypothetical protein
MGTSVKPRLIVSLPIILSFLASLLLVGCGGHVVVGEEEVFAPKQAIDIKTHLVSGTTSRDDVHRLFGTPTVSSETWMLELYRIDNEDEYGVYTWAIVPIPFMPTWFEAASQTIYVLIAYDGNWKVADFDTGYFVEEIFETRDAQRKNAETKDFLLEVDTIWKELEPASEWLYGRNNAAETILSAEPRSGFCTFYLVNTGVAARLFFDGDLYLNPQGETSIGFLAISSFPGKHIIKVLPYSRPMGALDYKGGSTKEVNCSDGQRLFIEIKTDLQHRKSYFERNTLTAEFEMSNKPLNVFKTHPLILYHNGKWVGPEKPSPD